MAIQLADSEDILTLYLGIASSSSGFSAKVDEMDLIRSGIESSIKRFCRWNLVQTDLTSYLPLQGQALGIHVLTAEVTLNRSFPTGTRNRLQLPAMCVKSITNIWENLSAVGGAGDDDFGDDNLLVQGTDYYLEKDSGGTSSWSGGVIRVGRNWSSIPGTIKVSFTAGFTESELQNDQNALRFAVIKECADHYVRHLRMKSQFVSGVGLGGATPDTSGLVSRLHIGDFDVGFRDSLADDKAESAGSYGLSERMRMFLQDQGYVLMNVGA